MLSKNLVFLSYYVPRELLESLDQMLLDWYSIRLLWSNIFRQEKLVLGYEFSEIREKKYIDRHIK